MSGLGARVPIMEEDFSFCLNRALERLDTDGIRAQSLSDFYREGARLIGGGSQTEGDGV